MSGKRGGLVWWPVRIRRLRAPVRLELILPLAFGLGLFLAACQVNRTVVSASGQDHVATIEYLGWAEDAIDQDRAARQIVDALLDEPRQDASWRGRLAESVGRWRQVNDDAQARVVPLAFARGQAQLLDGLGNYARAGDQIEEAIDGGDNRLLSRGLADLDYADRILDAAWSILQQEAQP